MLSRLPHVLLVALLLLGQIGGWLHELSHHAGGSESGLLTEFVDRQAKGNSGSSLPDDDSDRRCLLCSTFAVLALVFPCLVLALGLLALQFSLPCAARQFTLALRPRAHSARGPPLFS